MPRVTGEPMLKDLAPPWLPGDGLYKGKSIIVVTKGVRVVVSTDWSALGQGVVSWSVHLVLMQPWA